jgi:hypothetical protein
MIMRLALATCIVALPSLGAADDRGFPFEHELYLEVRPMAGSKRVPGLEVGPSGRASIDLWCASGPGQVVVAADTISIIAGPMSGLPGDPACSPERAQADAEVLSALSQVTNWRRDADVVTLVGPKPLRFHVSSH